MEQSAQTNVAPNYSNYQSYSDSQIKYAGFGPRFLAYVIDNYIISLISGSGIISSLVLLSLISTSNILFNILLAVIIGSVVHMGYYLIFWVKYDGATPGKKLLAIKIVKDNGEKLTYPVALVRWFGYPISHTLFNIGFLWVIWDKKKQALHDKIAGTVVVKTDKQPRVGLAISIVALVTIFAIIAFFFVVILIGTISTLKKSQVKKNWGKKVVSNVTNEKQPVAYEQQPVTQLQPYELASDVFAKLNERRKENNLWTFIEDPNLCSYAHKRLSDLTALGKDDGGEGFYEDLVDSSINQTYFSQYLTVGTVNFDLNLNPGSTSEDVVNAWTDVGYNVVMNSQHNYACVRANPQFIVIVAGQHK